MEEKGRNSADCESKWPEGILSVCSRNSERQNNETLKRN
jgi:hypothetical protein